MGDVSGITLGIVDFAAVALAEGDTHRYWRLSGAADELRLTSGTALGAIPFPSTFTWGLGNTPDNDADRAAFEAGRAMAIEEAVAEALEGRPAT